MSSFLINERTTVTNLFQDTGVSMHGIKMTLPDEAIF